MDQHGSSAVSEAPETIQATCSGLYRIKDRQRVAVSADGDRTVTADTPGGLEASLRADCEPGGDAMTGPDPGHPAAGSPLEGRQLGAWLRQQREDRRWTRRQMARQLAGAARSLGYTQIPGLDCLSHYVYRWERGTSGPSERYQSCYCQALGIPPSAFGVARRPLAGVPGTFTGAVLCFLDSVMQSWQALERELAAGLAADASPAPPGPQPGRALDALRLAWGDAYHVGHGSGRWRAMRRDGTGRLLTAATTEQLNAAIRADWALSGPAGAAAR